MSVTPKLILTIILLTAFYKLNNCKNPHIISRHDPQSWKSESGRFIFSSVYGGRLSLHCDAPYPIRWRTEGVLAPFNIIHILPSIRSLSLEYEKFQLQVQLKYFKSSGYKAPYSSLQVVCESIEDPNLRRSVQIFTTGNQTTLRSKTNSVKDSKIIPCFTTDFYTKVELFRDDEKVIENIQYNPIQGFISDKVFKGLYTCRQGDYQINIEAVEKNTAQDYFYNPKASVVAAYTDELIMFTCGLNLIPIKFEFENNLNVTISIDEKTTKGSARIQLIESLQTPNETREILSGNISCHFADEHNQLIKTWKFRFYPRPRISINRDVINRKLVVGCSTHEGYLDSCDEDCSAKRIQLVQCDSGAECHLIRRVLNNSDNYGTAQSLNYMTILNDNLNTLEYTTEFSAMNGMIKCETALLSGYEGTSRMWEYFLGLDMTTTYTNWKDAPKEMLISMDKVPQIVHANISSKFGCTALSYLFADKVVYELEYRNGSSVMLEWDESMIGLEYTESVPNWKMDHSIINGFSIYGVLHIFLPIESVAMHCHGLWWNSTEMLTTSVKFQTKYLEAPTIVNSSGIESITFYLKRRNKLSCLVYGEPQPKVDWTYRGQDDREFLDAFEVFTELLQSSSEFGDGYLVNLEFNSVREEYAGDYRCEARNDFGEGEKYFNLEIEGEVEGDGSRSKNYPLIIAGVLIILLLTVAFATALIIIRRRYLKAKELSRNLTDEEVQEFVDGNPAMLNDLRPSGETAAFYPYDSQLEIELADIEFDESDGFLGSGQFSYVMKGYIISKEKVVAVKVTKGRRMTVEMFKSLLSEVKIMAYLGEHENLVKLVGVCTENIRSRIIYIATEICEFGSLDQFLQQIRPTFQDLIDGNQRIDYSYLTEDTSSETILSTIDLIRFATQIASGMEYLSSKAVIHADLAARNILVTVKMTAKISDFGLSRKLYSSNH